MIAVINDLHLSYGSPFARVGAFPGNCGSLDPASRGVVPHGRDDHPRVAPEPAVPEAVRHQTSSDRDLT